MRRKPFVEQVGDMPGPWWFYLVGVYAGVTLALDFARYVPDSEGTHQLGNAAVVLVGIFGAVFSVAVALTKRRRPLDSGRPRA